MDARGVFRKTFECDPQLTVRAPGRVNLIGEHIDYSGGHVMPMALACGMEIALTPREDEHFHLCAEQFGQTYEGPRWSDKQDDPFWANYFFAVVEEFVKLGHAVPGMNVALDGNVPRGSGLSSSAAYEVAVAWALQKLLGTGMNRMEIALLGQRAENRFVGVNCGIMDQAISAGGKAGHAMLLDCAALESEQIPLAFDDKATVLVAHSTVRRGLSASAYNERRGTCDRALEIIREVTGKTYATLCEATMEDLDASSEKMDETMVRRARHAISEENRVRQAAEAMAQADLKRVGQLLDESHFSLRDDYEVSCGELDELTAMIRKPDGAYGARLTGAGFGGCTVALVETAAAEGIIEALKRDFYEPRNAEPIAFVTGAMDGVRVIED